MNNVSKWIFVCPKCCHSSVRLKKLSAHEYQNICEECDWKGIVAKESYLTEELVDSQLKTITEPDV